MIINILVLVPRKPPALSEQIRTTTDQNEEPNTGLSDTLECNLGVQLMLHSEYKLRILVRCADPKRLVGIYLIFTC